MRFVILAALAAVVTVPAQAEHLAPRNDCGEIEGVIDFQRGLFTAVANRNAEMLRPLVDPRVHLDFGGGEGWELLRERLEAEQFPLWDELEEVIRLGCAPSYDGAIMMPYYNSKKFPDGYDPFTNFVVTGERVPLYRSASDDQVARYLTWESVETIAFSETGEDIDFGGRWEVRTRGGERGFVDAALLRSIIDYRVTAERGDDGQWRIVTFIAGD